VTISYLLGSAVKGPVTLEIIETVSGDVIRRYSSDDPVEPPIPGRNIPDYWIRPAQRLATTPGLHRFVWDVRYAPPLVDRPSYPISAVFANTPREPRGMFVQPGTYQVRLSAAGKSLRQAVVVRMDPRVKTSQPDLALQFKLSRALDDALRRVAKLRAEIASRPAGATMASQNAATALQQSASQLQDLFEAIQQADARPTAAQEAAVADALKKAEAAIAGAK